eukprot:7968058-Pyramimonas_sp.AAC.3
MGHQAGSPVTELAARGAADGHRGAGTCLLPDLAGTLPSLVGSVHCVVECRAAVTKGVLLMVVVVVAGVAGMVSHRQRVYVVVVVVAAFVGGSESSVDGAHAEGYKCIPTGREFEFPWECREHCNSLTAREGVASDGRSDENDDVSCT